MPGFWKDELYINIIMQSTVAARLQSLRTDSPYKKTVPDPPETKIDFTNTKLYVLFTN